MASYMAGRDVRLLLESLQLLVQLLQLLIDLASFLFFFLGRFSPCNACLLPRLQFFLAHLEPLDLARPRDEG